jgi:hypothetical protein
MDIRTHRSVELTKLAAPYLPESEGPGGMFDRQYSFMLAEVLKCAYIFHTELRSLHYRLQLQHCRSIYLKFSCSASAIAEAFRRLKYAHWQVGQNDANDFVFNTEAHPLKVAGHQM